MNYSNESILIVSRTSVAFGGQHKVSFEIEVDSGFSESAKTVEQLDCRP